jgi:hypothetical protein
MSKYPSIKKSGVEIDFNDDYIYVRITNNNHDGTYDRLFSSAVVISFDDERYERIYKSLLKQVNEVGYFAGVPNNNLFGSNIHSNLVQVIPETHLIKPTDFSKWEKEDLVKFIEEGKSYQKDKRPYFKSSLFDVKYPTNSYAFYDIIDNKLKSGKCQKDIYHGFVCISDKYEEKDYGKVIENNAPLIKNYLKSRGYTHINSFEVCNFYYTEELIAPFIIVLGAKMDNQF